MTPRRCFPLPDAAQRLRRTFTPPLASSSTRTLRAKCQSAGPSHRPADGLPRAQQEAQKGVFSSVLFSLLTALTHSALRFVTHYFHGLNMATVLFAMGGYGTYLGWKVRAGGGAEPTFGTADSAAELHPKLMAGMTLFFLAGGQGGLLFNLLQGKPLLDSPHAVSALAGLMLLGANGVLGGLMGDSPNLRTTHALLGSSLMLVFVVHAGLGIQLALSL